MRVEREKERDTQFRFREDKHSLSACFKSTELFTASLLIIHQAREEGYEIIGLPVIYSAINQLAIK